MKSNRLRPILFVLLPLVLAGLSVRTVHSQTPTTGTLEQVIPPGANYDKAEFRLWLPSNPGRLQATLVLVPGSNGDGRGMVQDSVWQAFATQHKVALVGCRFTDKPHEQGFIEEYINVSQGSGQALLDALTAFGAQSKHDELATAPLMFWGMSAGGEFNYEFVAWKPERVIAFVVNKGGIYYTALTSRATRSVPGLLFIGEKDLDSRKNTISGLFAVNRRGGALWALVEEPGAGHIVGRSRDLGAIFFEDVLALRLDSSADGNGASGLRALSEKSGLVGDLKAKMYKPLGESAAPNTLTAWLPTERVARAWQAVLMEKPFSP